MTDDVTDGSDAAAPRPTATGTAALAGAVSAAVALGVGELVSSLGGTDHTLVTAVGTSFIDRFAGALKDLAVSLFGTNDKAALVVGIVVVCTGLGALAGSRHERQPWLSWALFCGFALLGAGAATSDPLASSAFGVAGAAAAAGAGLVSLRMLMSLASGDPRARPTRGAAPAVAGAPRLPAPLGFEDPRNPAATRRAFFGWTGAATAFAATAAAGSRQLNAKADVEVARTGITLPRPTNTAATGATRTTLESVAGPGGEMIEGLTPYIVPNRSFYKIDTSLVSPNVDPRNWTLSFTGMVDNPFSLTFDELLSMADTEETVTIACVSNEVGGYLVGNARWQGVPLRKLLDRAGVQAGAGQIVGVSVDGFTAGFPLDTVDGDRVALVAVGMNGEPLPVDHGFPARLIIAGLYGYVSATKWLEEVRLTTWEGFDGYWMPRGWSKLGPVKTQSRIDVPSYGSVVRPGRVPVAGVAWAPTRGITKVEVQVDDSAWQEARLGDVVSDSTWCQWVLPWDATPGDHRIRVRATDGAGQTQTEAEARPDPDGATGWHTVRVRVEGS